MIATGEVIVFLLNTTSLCAFQIVLNAPAHRNNVTCCFFPLSFVKISKNSAEQLVGDNGQLRHSRKKDHKNTTMGHWNKIWSDVSSLSQLKHSSGPGLFFFNWTPLDSIMYGHPDEYLNLQWNGTLPDHHSSSISDTSIGHCFV